MSFVETLTKSDKQKTGAVLTKIQELLSDKNRWTQGDYAIDEEGEDATDRYGIPRKNAVAYCLIGAARKVNTKYESVALRVLDEIAREMTGNKPSDAWPKSKHPATESIWTVNDDMGYAAVKTLIRRAIKKVGA